MAEDGSGYFNMSAAVAEQYQLLAASNNVMQYKRCNCKKAKCLKLYCVCFAAGVYCQSCNCADCSNIPEKSELVMAERQRVLQREPMAFTTKLMGPAHMRGCKCKRSRCVKKYCDCFDASVRCSEMCKCKDCQNQPDGFNGAAAAAAGAPSMSMALGPQHHAMLLAMQQQQQAEYDPAALARLQLFGGAGFPPDSLEAAASGAGGSQPPSRAASPGLASFIPAASQAFAAGAAAAGLQFPLAGLPHPAAAAAAAAAVAGSQGLGAGDLSNALHAASQEVALSQAQPLLQSQSQANMYQLGHFGAFHQQEHGQWQHMMLEQQQQGAEAWHGQDPAAAAGADDSQADEQQDLGSGQGLGQQPHNGLDAADPAAASVRLSQRMSDPGVSSEHMQLPLPPAMRRGSSAPVGYDAAAAAAAAAGAAAVPPAAAGKMPRSASMGAEPRPAQPPNQPRASSLPPPDAAAAAAMFSAAHAASGAARGVRRSLQQPPPLSRHGSAAELLTDLKPAAAYAAELAAAELPPAAAAAAAGQGLYAPYRITKVEPLVYPSALPALAAAAGAARGVEELEPETQQQFAEEELGTQDPPGGEQQDAAQGAQAYGSMHEHNGLHYEAEEHPEANQQVLLAAGAAAEHDPGSAMAQEQAVAAAAAAAAAGRGGMEDEGPFQSSAAAMAASNSAAAAAAAAMMAATANEDAAAGALGPVALGMLDDPSAAGMLAANLGLCDNVQQAAINAAKFLRDILNLSRMAAGPSEPTGSFTGSQQQPLPLEDQQQPGSAANGQGAATPAFSAGGVSATHEHQPQPGSRLRHSSSAVQAAARPAGSLLASASLGHWGTTNTPASKAAAAAGNGGPLGSGMSPAVSAGSDVHLQQQRQQHVVALTPQCAPPGHAGGGPGAAAAAAAGAGPGTGVTSAGSVSFAKSLGGGVYAPGAGGITPLPLAAAHAPGVRLNSCLRGPSPLGPVGFNRDSGGAHRETAGLQALMGPQTRDRQQQQHVGTSDACGGSGEPGSAARRSMQLLPGSFRLAAGNNNSPGVGSPAVAAALGHSGAMQAAADSPAGSVSFAHSIASAAPAAGAPAAAEPQERTPVYTNAQKQPCGMYDVQQRQEQLEEGHHMDLQEGLAAENLNGYGARGAAEDHSGDDAVLLPTSSHPASTNTTPVPASAAALAAAADAAASTADLAAAATAMPGGVHTPLSAALVALGAAITAPTPSLQQQAQQLRMDTAAAGGRAGGSGPAADGADAAAGVTHLFGTTAGGATNLQDMTPSSLFIASLLAANRTPTDMFLTSPLPPIGSALRQAGLGSAGPLSALHSSALAAGGGAARGVTHADAAGVGVGIALRGGQVTPLSLHGLHGATGTNRQTPGSDLGGLGATAAHGTMPKRNSRTGRGGGLGVGALCTGILRGSAAEEAQEAARSGGQQQQQQPAAVPGSSAGDAAAAAAAGEPVEQQEDAAASGMKPDTDKAAARAAAAAADTAAFGAAAAGLTSPVPAAGVGSLLAAANYISTPRDAGIARGRPLSGEEGAAEGPAAKRQRLNSGGTPAGHGSGKEGCGRGGAGLQEQQQQQHLSPALFKPAPCSAAAAKAQSEQDIKHEVDAAGLGGSAAAMEVEVAAAGVGVMHPPRQQRHRHDSSVSDHRSAHSQKQLSALQQLLQGPAPAAGAAAADVPVGEAAEADMWIEWRRQQQQAGAVGGVKAEAMQYHLPQRQQQQQQQQRGLVEALQGQQQQDMKSPPVPTQRREIHGQGTGSRDRSPSMESVAAADVMLSLCQLKRL